MADHLREPNEYPVVFALISQDGRVITRVDTGLVARWIHNELVVPLDTDEAEMTLRGVTESVRRETS